jgi:hypothetical protein
MTVFDSELLGGEIISNLNKIKDFMKRLDKIVRQKRESMRYIVPQHEIEFIEYLSPEEQMLYYLSK